MTNNTQGLLYLPKTYLISMKESPKYKWFKPLLAVILAAAFYGLLIIIVGLCQYLAGLGFPGVEEAVGTATNNDNYIKEDMTDPLQVFFMCAMVGIMIPAAGLAAKITGLGGMESLSSVEGGLRWNRIAKLILPVLAITLVFTTVIPLAVSILDGGLDQMGTPTFAPAGLIAILLFVPFQCAGEEYIYRGLLQKALGSWIPIPIVVILIQAALFGISHGYNDLGNLAIVVDGILWGALAVKTGGLEATICLHAANNVTSMMLGSIFASASVSTTMGIENFIFNIISSLATCAVAYFVCKKNGYLIEK